MHACALFRVTFLSNNDFYLLPMAAIIYPMIPNPSVVLYRVSYYYGVLLVRWQIVTHMDALIDLVESSLKNVASNPRSLVTNKRILSYKDALQRTELRASKQPCAQGGCCGRGRCSAWVTIGYPRGSCR